MMMMMTVVVMMMMMIIIMTKYILPIHQIKTNLSGDTRVLLLKIRILNG